MRRREFIELIGGAAATWPLAARAQQGQRMQRIGMLMAFAEGDQLAQTTFVAAFRDELHKLGWVEGRNIRFDIRWGVLDAETMQRDAKELVATKPDLILAQSTGSRSVAARNKRYPDHFRSGWRPGRLWLGRELPAAGRHVTGFTGVEPTMASKWLELLKEIAPRVTRAVLLFNPPTAPYAEVFVDPAASSCSAGAQCSIGRPLQARARQAA